MEQGFIVLHRKLSENWLWLSEPFSKSQAWIDLLLLANHAEGSFFIRGVKVIIKRGHVGKSEESLSQRWKWSRGKVRAFLKMLETEQQIKQHKSPILNIIEVVNYNLYQKLDNKKNNKKTTESQQKDTNNKEELTMNEEIMNIPDFIDKKLLNSFFAFRESMATTKKPFTLHARELILKDLVKFEATRTGFANLALENAIKNSWQGVFEPKDNQGFSGKPSSPITNPFAIAANKIAGSNFVISGKDNGYNEWVVMVNSRDDEKALQALSEEKRAQIKALVPAEIKKFIFEVKNG